MLFRSRPLFLLRPNINNELKNIVPIYCISTEEQVLNNISVLLNSPGELDKIKKPNNEPSSIYSSSPLRNSFSHFSSFIKINKKNRKETNNYIVEKITPGTNLSDLPTVGVFLQIAKTLGLEIVGCCVGLPNTSSGKIDGQHDKKYFTELKNNIL